ncbi:hypothetical protein GUJ93_ZPchr0009g411 [Zizania palustris]|uniref:Uncharacterized protein n=1 Tax=Zizania palustris TaxID=103762 RepID=A0A8J5RJR5_ZIZPA|nr:hypothetical protein GUJ93_ZPchr0009g411 [Zizania palustris]
MNGRQERRKPRKSGGGRRRGGTDLRGSIRESARDAPGGIRRGAGVWSEAAVSRRRLSREGFLFGRLPLHVGGFEAEGVREASETRDDAREAARVSTSPEAHARGT